MELQQLITAPLDKIIGQAPAKQALKSALLARRNCILVGPPGVGKTTLAKEVAAALGDVPFIRVQGSPDLTAEDLIGDIDPAKALQYGPTSVEAFTKGKIFRADGGILFFDEINRCTEKLQNALLQVLEERRVTVGTYDVDFPSDFLFIGTMNPDDSSTEQLSTVFLDRFDLITMEYPATVEEELRITERASLHGVTLDDELRRGIIMFLHALRADKNLDRKPSVRATLGIIERAATTALLRGADAVSFADVAAVIVSVLSHRISLKASVKYLESVEEYVRSAFRSFATEHGFGGDG